VLHDLVRAAARRTPNALAVCGPDGRLTYTELDALADGMAREFARLGVEPGERVVIWLDKSAAAVAATQAALRIGAAYVPIDGLAPAGRASAVISDCAAALVVTSPALACQLDDEATTAAILRIDQEWCDARRQGPRRGPEPFPKASSEPDDLAYILYTSGSTGSPKGVCLTHRNALAFIEWSVAEIGATSADNFANHAPMTFDLSVFDLYAAFSVGACVHLITQDLAYSPGRLVDFLDDHEISVWYSVPAALLLMIRHGDLLDRRPQSLRTVLFAGEEFPIDALRRLLERLPEARFFNLYGPTETNVCTFWEVHSVPPDRTLPVPIGTSCSGDTVTAIRPDGSAAGVGEIGELVVEGPTVMAGYWGMEPQAGRPYVTGDLVRVLKAEDGGFQFLGRRDTMAKVRGHRVELGEIESVLAGHPGIEEAAVVVVGQSIDAQIVAFVVPRRGAAAVTLMGCKEHCASRLPRYAIIDRLHTLAAVPRTANGKVDRSALMQQINPQCAVDTHRSVASR